MEIKHFIFSRFNVQYLEMVPFNLGLNPDQWMEERIQLFFDYCYPSVKHQSQKSFRWIVFFDTRTPEGYMNIISENDSEGIIEYLYTDHWDKIDKEILNFLNNQNDDLGLVISTRLDCDDAISTNFINTLQKKVAEKKYNPPYALNCSNGIILDTNTQVFYRKRMRSNPFISVVQANDQILKSIFGMEHQLISDQMKTLELQDPNMWLQIIHGRNLLNKASGLPLRKNLSSDFNILLTHAGARSKSFDLTLAYLKYLNVRASNLRFKINKVLGFKLL